MQVFILPYYVSMVHHFGNSRTPSLWKLETKKPSTPFITLVFQTKVTHSFKSKSPILFFIELFCVYHIVSCFYQNKTHYFLSDSRNFYCYSNSKESYITLFNFSIKMKNISINVVKFNVLNEFSGDDSKWYATMRCFIRLRLLFVYIDQCLSTMDYCQVYSMLLFNCSRRIEST